MLVVTVEFVVKPDHVDDFHAAIVENARASKRSEPGCRQFDVCVAPADAARIFLYEVYDDAPAFDAHVASEHFRAFDARARDWVVGKTVHRFDRIEPAGKA
jgi:quinol monooxygenase YgiN